jgi:hypothetical protein
MMERRYELKNGVVTLADLDKLLAMDGEACIIGAKRR